MHVSFPKKKCPSISPFPFYHNLTSQPIWKVLSSLRSGFCNCLSNRNLSSRDHFVLIVLHLNQQSVRWGDSVWILASSSHTQLNIDTGDHSRPQLSSDSSVEEVQNPLSVWLSYFPEMRGVHSAVRWPPLTFPAIPSHFDFLKLRAKLTCKTSHSIINAVNEHQNKDWILTESRCGWVP